MPTSGLYTVVHVENSASKIHSRTRRLREMGYRVIEASSNEEAFRLAEQEVPALVLLQDEDQGQFRIVADHAPVLLWMNGLEGCEFVNRAYLAFLGVTDAAVQGYDWAEFIHPEDRRGYVTAYLEAVAERRLFEATFRFRRYDGEYRWMRSIGRPRFSDDGRYLGYVGSTIDVSDSHTLDVTNKSRRTISADLSVMKGQTPSSSPLKSTVRL